MISTRLPENLVVAPTQGVHFVQLSPAEAVARLTPFLTLSELWLCGFSLPQAATAEDLLRKFGEEGTLRAWRMEGGPSNSGGATLVLSYCVMMYHVSVFHPQGWSADLNALGLRALARALFPVAEDCDWLMTAVPHPEPHEAEDALAMLGYVRFQASFDKLGRHTFGLERCVHEAYSAAEQDDAFA